MKCDWVERIPGEYPGLPSTAIPCDLEAGHLGEHDYVVRGESASPSPTPTMASRKAAVEVLRHIDVAKHSEKTK